ncbi:hypothetical protein H4O14_02030 [Bacillus sp. PAMC26568]|nr:hypothetical protein H4O14_02030 [Bacillus sp. PAMC26568]
MGEQNRTQQLIDFLRVLGELKSADYYANQEIKKVIEQIQSDLGMR